MTTRVVLADDHALIRRGLRDTLAQDGGFEVVGEAGDWTALEPLLASTGCEVLLLDINLPGRSGLQILEALAKRASAPHVMVVSMYPEDQYAVQSLRAGALAYLNKAGEPGVLLEALRSVARGRKYLTPAVANLLVNELTSPEQALPHHRLTERERELLVLIARGVPLPDIAQSLDMTPKTVGVYRARLLEKMKLPSNAQLAHYAQRHGLLH